MTRHKAIKSNGYVEAWSDALDAVVEGANRLEGIFAEIASICSQIGMDYDGLRNELRATSTVIIEDAIVNTLSDEFGDVEVCVGESRSDCDIIVDVEYGEFTVYPRRMYVREGLLK